MMRQRRDVLKIGLMGAFGSTLPGGAITLAADAPAPPAAAPASTPAPPPFSAAVVLGLARGLAGQPFKAPKPALPDVLAALTYDQYVSIRVKPSAAIWNGDNTGFIIEPLQRGFIFSTAVEINLVANGAVAHVPYDKNQFDLGKLQLPPDMGDIGFSGFRVMLQGDGGALSQLAIFQGASFFRAVARGQNFGVTARGLALHTADQQGEEFPIFRSFWIERPSPANKALVIHALLDSTSVVGAFQFTIRPGEATIIDTEMTLIPRNPIDHVGIGAMTATYLLGSMDRRHSEDVRPNIYEIDGLQMLTGKNEWLWRPVSNRNTLQISAFADQNPHGFGLLQRSRKFDTFEDDDAHWELRPSLWIEPIGDWTEGEIVLVEIPSESENNDNIIAYWRPKTVIEAGVETSFAYRQFWCWQPPARPNLAIATSERTGKLGRKRRFIVQFTGDIFADAQKSSDIKVNLSVSPGQYGNVRVFDSAERKSFRVVFDLEPGSETFAEIRLVLEQGGAPISETWLYRWTP